MIVVEETVDEDPDPEEDEEGGTDVWPDEDRSPDDQDTEDDKKDPDDGNAKAMLVGRRTILIACTLLGIHDCGSQESKTKADQPGG